MKKNMSSERAWVFAAIGLLVLAVFLTIVSLSQLPGRQAGLRARQERMSQLRKLAKAGELGRAARRSFEAIEHPTPLAIDRLADFFAGGVAPEIRDMANEDLDSGWVLRRAEVRFSDIALENLWMLLRQAENQRPPWRLREIQAQASAAEPGRGQAVLILEALARPPD